MAFGDLKKPQSFKMIFKSLCLKIDCFLPFLTKWIPSKSHPRWGPIGYLKKKHQKQCRLGPHDTLEQNWWHHQVPWHHAKWHHAKCGEAGALHTTPLSFVPKALPSLLWMAKLTVLQHWCEPGELKTVKPRTPGKILLCQCQQPFTLASVGTQHLLERSNTGRQGEEGRKSRRGRTEIDAEEQEEKGKHFRENTFQREGWSPGTAQSVICWINRADRVHYS